MGRRPVRGDALAAAVLRVQSAAAPLAHRPLQLLQRRVVVVAVVVVLQLRAQPPRSGSRGAAVTPSPAHSENQKAHPGRVCLLTQGGCACLLNTR